MNMFIRSHPGFEIEADKAKANLRNTKVVASDQTGRRIEGTNSYHWVFHCKAAVVHQPDYSRGARVVEETMGGHEPEVWIRIVIPRSKSMAPRIKLVLPIWRAIRLLRWSMDRTICPCGSSCGLARPSIWPERSPVSKPRRSPAKSASLKSNSRPFSSRRQDATSHVSCRPKSAGRKSSF